MKIARKWVYFENVEFEEFLRENKLVTVMISINTVRGNHYGYIVEAEKGRILGYYFADHRGVYKISKKTYNKIVEKQYESEKLYKKYLVICRTNDSVFMRIVELTGTKELIEKDLEDYIAKLREKHGATTCGTLELSIGEG